MRCCWGAGTHGKKGGEPGGAAIPHPGPNHAALQGANGMAPIANHIDASCSRKPQTLGGVSA